MRIPFLPRMKLEGKSFVLIGLTLAICISFSYYLLSRAQHDIVLGEVRKKAKLLADQVTDLTKWQSAVVAATRRRYSWRLFPKPLQNIIEQTFSGIQLTHPIAYDSRSVRVPRGPDGDMVDVPVTKRWYAWRFVSEKTIADNVAVLTPFEQYAWSQLTDPANAAEDVEYPVPDDDVFRYARRLRAQGYCLTCHRHAAWSDRVGDPDRDTVGIFALEMGIFEQQRALERSNRLHLWVAVGTFLATLFVLFILLRNLIIRPLSHLKDVSDRISEGDLSVRAVLHTGDEMESFAVVFNRMVESVEESQRRLHVLNRSLDVKLTELGQANLKLFEMNRLRGQFLANMSHELRTPLNAIIGFSEVLGDQAGGTLNDKQARYVRNVLTAGRHLLRLINELLDLARIESGKMEVSLRRVSLSAVVENVAAMREATLGEGRTLTREVDDDIPPMLTDEGKLTQVIDNLVGNAVKFTDPGGHIDLHARRDGASVEITVTDDGVGIPKEDQEFIFDTFRQVDASDTRRHAGAGLGLAIVREMVTMLGGTVAVDSEPGRGSTFTVRLPLESPQHTPPRKPGAEIG